MVGELTGRRRFSPSLIMVVAIVLAGGIASEELVRTPWPAWALAAAACALVSVSLRRGRLAAVFLVLASLAAGAFHHSVHRLRRSQWNISASVPATGMLARARGRVIDSPRRFQSKKAPWLARTSATVEMTEIQTDAGWRPACGRMNLSVYGGDVDIDRGYLVEYAGTLRPIPGPSNPGAFDYRTFYGRKGVGARMTLKGPEHLKVLERRHAGLLTSFRTFVRWRARMVARRHLSEDKANLLLCLVSGDRDAVGREVRDVLARAGILHFFVVSGLHVGLVAGAFFVVLRIGGLREWAVAVISGAAAFLYVALTGFNTPAVRAFVMIAALLARMLSGRHGSVWDALALAGLVILLYNPTQLFSVGFQLSFVAVIFILLLHHPISRRIRFALDGLSTKPETRRERWRRRRILRAFASAAAVSAAAWLGVWIILARAFHLVAPVSVFANLIYLPLILTALFVGLLFLALSVAAPPLAAAPAFIAGEIVGLTFSLAKWIAGLRFSHFYVADVPDWMVWTYFAAIGVFLAAGGLRRRLRLAIRIATIATVGVLFAITQLPEKEFAFEVLDVGHGLATAVLAEEGGTIIFDCGSSRGARSACEAMSGLLWQRGRRSVDLLVLSHPDRDHTNGVLLLAERFRVKRVCLGPGFGREEDTRELQEFLEERGAEIEIVREYREIVAGGMRFRLRGGAARNGKKLSSNDSSLSMRFSKGAAEFLVLGDQEEEGIALLADSGSPSADVLVLGHHGTALSNMHELLADVSCEIAIASSGPRDDTSLAQSLIAQRGARFASTATDGAIEVTLSAGRVELAGFVTRGDAR